MLEQVDGECIECGAPCTDHDLVADWYWCADCTNKGWEAMMKNAPSTELSIDLDGTC